MPVDTLIEPGPRADELILNMGPQHPSTHGVLRLLLRVDGEVVKGCRPDVGYLHRCAEKIAESVNYNMFIPYSDRMDYLAGMNNNHAYCLGVEKLAGIAVPERGEFIRVIMLELNRIASHLMAIGTYGLDVGAITPFLHCFRERERILDLFEEVCGARLLYNYVRIGGVRNDLPEGWTDRCRKFLDYFEPKVPEYNRLLTYNPIFIKRTAGVGVLPPAVAIDYGCTGPMLRGSGVRWDLRRDDPYSVYPRLAFDVPVGRGEMGATGDCWDRYWVRMEEMRQSVRILRQALDMLPAGPHAARVSRMLKVAPGEVYVRTENPRGELGVFLVSDGTLKPYRCNLRSPCFSNLSVIDAISRGCLVADMVAILGSIDIVLGEVDR